MSKLLAPRSGNKSPRDNSPPPRNKKPSTIAEQLAECQAALQREQLRRQACEAELEELRAERTLGVPSSLCSAAAAGELDTLRLLARGDKHIVGSRGIDVNQGDYDKRTALHLAASEGQQEAALCLLDELGAAPSPRDRWGNTPLDDAIRHGYTAMATMLESHGGCPGLGTGQVGAVHLCKAAASGDTQRLKLLAATADVNQGDYDKRTPLHIAASEGREDGVKCLLAELSAAASPEDRWGNTPLDDAIRHGHQAIAALLESHGGSKGLGTGQVGAQHLCKAAAAGDMERLKVLARTTDVSQGDYDKRTALHLAAAEGLQDVAETLMELGARVSPMDRWGFTPLDEARRNGHAAMITLLESNGGYSGASRRTAAGPPAAAAAPKQPAEKAIPSVPLSAQRLRLQDMNELGVLNLGLELDGESGGATSLPSVLVGTFSCAGSEVGRDMKKVLKTNQDCACVATPLKGDSTMAAFCVFDGHGRCGHHVSQEALHALHFELERAPLDEQIGAALPAVFEAVQAHLRLLAAQPEIQVDARSSGACAVVAVLRGRRLTVAGVGDCRAVLATTSVTGLAKAMDLSVDHKVDTPAERERIEATGAAVRTGVGTTDSDDYEPPRVYHELGRPWLGPGLQMSRVLGDLDAEGCGIIAKPDVVERTVQDDDRFLILASDGVWEFIDSAEAVQIVDQFYSAGKPAHEACKMLIVKAAVRWAQKEGPIRDDITAVVVYLSGTAASLESRSGTPRGGKAHV